MIDCFDSAIASAFTPLLGQPCWRVERGQGSILSFEFGAPRLFVREPRVSTSPSAKVRRKAARRLVKPIGEWHLFIFCCHWRAIVFDKVLADDESTPKHIEAAACEMDGQKLTEVTLDALSRETTFSFDLGATLKTSPYQADEEEQWSLYLPDNQVLTYRSDGLVSLCASDQKPGSEIWKALQHSLRLRSAHDLSCMRQLC